MNQNISNSMNKANKGYKRAIGKLRKEIAGNPAIRPEVVTELWTGQIEMVEPVFQPRSMIGNLDQEKKHLKGLADALKNLSGEPLDPLTVWWSGRRWLVIDGHHRLKAYHAAGQPWEDQRKVPVNEFKGSLEDAQGFAVRENAKSKLEMTEDDKFNAAWRMFCQGQKSKAEVCRDANISDGLAGKMRRALKQLLAEANWIQDSDDAAGLTWSEAWRASNGLYSALDDADEELSPLEQTAHAWAKRLEKTFGPNISKNPEAFALALAILNDDIPMKLVETEAWKEHMDAMEQGWDEEAEDEMEAEDELIERDF